MKVFKGIALLLALAVSAPLGATQTTFTTNAGTAANGTLINTAGAPAPLYCNSSGCQTTAPLGMYVTITAWSTPAPVTALGTSPTDTGTWVAAFLAIYGSNGIGISNTQQGTGATAAAPETYAQLTCSSGCPASNPEHVGNVPQHAIDNSGEDDILVVDFGSTGWDVNSFSLGYTCSINSLGTGCNTTTSVTVRAWIGGTAPTNFSANGATGVPSPGGFTSLTLSNDPATGNVTMTDSASTTGRYLVITGSLTGSTDAFKVSKIVATTPTTIQGVPSPGSLPLLGLGLLALTLVRRRFALIA